MSVEFEDHDLSGAVFWGVYLRNARFRDVDFTGVRTHHVLLHDVEFDGPIDQLVINGVDVTDYVNQLDPWQPLRGMAEPAEAEGVRRSWAAFTSAWGDLISEVAALPPLEATVSVDGEWSFVQTVRHLLFVADKWILGPMTDQTWSPLGLPNSGSADHGWPDIAPDANPTIDEVLAERADQATAVSALAASVDDDRLSDTVTVLENGTVAVLDCWHTLFEESFEHLRYARRDLDQLDR